MLESAERLRRELHPERGPVDWRPIRERRKQAEARIQAVEDYARDSRCRRARLVGYFGESLARCAGCDRCGSKSAPSSADPDVLARLARLRRALADRRTVWGGCPLEPEVLLCLAKRPPADAAVLADVPGVGPALAERLGGTILRALSSDPAAVEPSQDNVVPASLENWRSGLARQMGVPPYLVITDAVLQAIANARPQSRLDLARIRGVGPRLLAKFADDLLRMHSAEPGPPEG